MIIDAFLSCKNKEMAHSAMPERGTGTDFKIKLVVIAAATLTLISSLIISVCALLQLQHLQEEVANLRWEIDQLQLGDIIDSELMNDLKKFENEDLNHENTINLHLADDSLDDDDWFESDYDIDYDNFDTLDSEEGNISPPGQDDISVVISKSNAEGFINDRTKRDTTASIPVVRELYNSMARTNETTERKASPETVAHISSPNVLPHLKKRTSEDHYANPRSRRRRAKAAAKLHQWEPIEEDSAVEESSEPRRRNRHRQKNNIEIFDEKPRTVHVRPSPAIQLVGDTSKYVMGQHTNYNGNGHLQHIHPTYVDWIPNDWVQGANMDKYFEVNGGTIKIKESGIYFVYAQIFYLDEHDTNGYRVYKNKEVFLQCTTMTHSLERVIKGNTCYTAGLSLFNERDEVHVQDLGTGRYSIFEPGKSFFGLIKIADVKSK